MIELLTRMESLWCRETHVVSVECVGHHQMWTSGLDPTPKREVVGVIVRVVFKVVILGTKPRVCSLVRPVYQPAGFSPVKRAWISIAFSICSRSLRFRDPIVIDPSISVTRDLMSVIQKRLDHLWMSLHRHRHAEHRQRSLARPKQLQNPPDPCPRTVLID